MPDSQTTLSGKSTMSAPSAAATKTEQKKLFIGIGIALVVVAILGAVLYFSGALNGLLGRNNVNAGFDASKPEETVSMLNTYTLEAVKAIDTETGTIDYTEMLSKLGMSGAVAGYDAAGINLEFSVEGTGVNLKITLDGVVKNSGNNKGVGKLAGKISSNSSDFGNVEVPLEMIVIDQVGYFKIGEVPSSLSDLSPELGIIAKIFEDQWIKLDTEEATQLGSIGGLQSRVNQEDKDQLLSLWEKNPLFLNGRSTDNRSVTGASLNCMLTDINEKAFGEEQEIDLPALELCTNAGGTLPVFIGMDIPETQGTKGKFGITITAANGDVKVEAPAGAKTLEELFGGLSGM